MQFSLTTAISYMNGEPHIGHSYEIILADCINRYYKYIFNNCFLLTGSDEHGKKIENKANNLNITCKELCDMYVKEFRDLYSLLDIQYDRFIRTSEENHINNSLYLFDIMYRKGDIYQDLYDGWYNTREECYISNSEALKCNFIDNITGEPFQRLTEKAYFFKLSKYEDTLKEFYKNNKDFIQPVEYYDELSHKLNNEKLRDICISRNDIINGIKIPNDNNITIYVWFEALMNYITGINDWPPSVQIIGKDILWFHGIIFPAMLLSLNLQIPNLILVHGHILDSSGRKMSKSLSNTIDSNKLIEITSTDTFRWFLLQNKIGKDINVDTDKFINTHKMLINLYGNLVNRIVKLIKLKCNNRIPVSSNNYELLQYESITDIVKNYIQLKKIYKISRFSTLLLKDINKYLTDSQPWKLNDHIKINNIIHTITEALYFITMVIHPIIPSCTSKVFECLKHENTKLRCYKLIADTEIGSLELLFKK